MKFTSSKKGLALSLEILHPIFQSNSLSPITACIKLEAIKGELYLTATDLSITSVLKININIESEGVCIVNGKKLISIIKKLNVDNVIYFNKEGSSLKIKSGNTKFEIAINEEISLYPKTPEDINVNKFEIESLILKEYINKTLFAASNDDLRAILTGTLFSFNNSTLTMVTTDSVMLVKYSNKKAQYPCESKDIVLPSKSLNIINNSIVRKDLCKIYFTENYAEFDMGNIKIFTRLINGKYPAYNAIIPVNNNNKVFIDRIALINTVDRVSLASNPLTKLIRLNISKNNLIISSEDSSTSSRANDKLLINYNGADLFIGFNSVKFISLLKNLNSKIVCLNIDTPSKPVLIIVDDEDILSLIMPVKIS